MKICSQCGQINDDDARFCVRDGWALPDSVDETKKKLNIQICKECGFENSPEVKFCGGCGKPLGKETKEKQKDDKSVLAFVKLFTLIFGIFIALSIAVNIHDMDFSELFDDASELFEDKKDYYFRVHMHHSSEIDKDGETINFSVDTDAERFDVRNLRIRVLNVYWKAVKGESLPYGVSLGSYDWNEDYALKPILDIEFVDDKNFRIIIDENLGYNREIDIRMNIENAKEGIYGSFGETLSQRGYRGLVKRK